MNVPSRNALPTKINPRYRESGNSSGRTSVDDSIGIHPLWNLSQYPIIKLVNIRIASPRKTIPIAVSAEICPTLDRPAGRGDDWGEAMGNPEGVAIYCLRGVTVADSWKTDSKVLPTLLMVPAES